MPVATRTCVCVQKDIGYLSAHLKNKLKLVYAKERASLLKRSFECERGHVNEKANEMFYEQEQILGVSFKDIEDRSLELRLQALQTEYSAINEQCFRLDTRAKLLLIYVMIIKSLETLLIPMASEMKREDVAPLKHFGEALD